VIEIGILCATGEDLVTNDEHTGGSDLLGHSSTPGTSRNRIIRGHDINIDG
jgi:hypothetical protein